MFVQTILYHDYYEMLSASRGGLKSANFEKNLDGKLGYFFGCIHRAWIEQCLHTSCFLIESIL